MNNKSTHKKDINTYGIDAAKLWAKIAKAGDDDCWHWLGALNTGGYGLMSVRNSAEAYERTVRTWSQVLAHRAVMWLHHGDLARNAYIMHKCDNPRCCNPGHMHIGSQMDNVHDMMAKGRDNFDGRNSR